MNPLLLFFGGDALSEEAGEAVEEWVESLPPSPEYLVLEKDP